MAQNTKIIRELETARGVLEQNLADKKTQLGYELLNSDQLFVTFRQSKEDLGKTTALLTEHQTAVSSLTERLASAKKEKNELEKQLENAAHVLGQFLFDNYEAGMADSFGGAYSMASGMAAAIKNAEDELNHIETEIGNAKLIKKVTLQLKKTGVQNTIASETKKLTQFLDQSARTLIMENRMTAAMGGNPWSDACTVRERITETDALMAELTAERAEHEQGKKDCKDTIDELTKSCSAQKKQCDERAFAEGSAYVAEFIGTDAETLKSFPAEYDERLQSILDSTREIKEKNRVIELKKLEDTVAECQTQIEKMQADYENNLRCIAQLQEHNETVQQNIAGTKTLIENYKAQIAALTEE